MTIATHQWTLFTTAKAWRRFFNTRRVGRTRTEQNIIVRIGRSKGELTNDKRWHSTYLLLNLTTDRHEASHGLPATAELLVISMKRKFTAKLAIYSVVIIHHKLFLCFIFSCHNTSQTVFVLHQIQWTSSCFFQNFSQCCSVDHFLWISVFRSFFLSY